MTNKKPGQALRAVQAIYQWQMTGQDIRDVKEQFLAEQDRNGFDFNYFGTLLQGYPTTWVHWINS